MRSSQLDLSNHAVVLGGAGEAGGGTCGTDRGSKTGACGADQ